MTTCIHDLIPEWCAICNGADVEEKDEPLTFQGLITGRIQRTPEEQLLHVIFSNEYEIKNEVKPSSHFHAEGNDAKDL